LYSLFLFFTSPLFLSLFMTLLTPHSFPTRRSSDLSEVLGGKRDVAQEVRIPGPDQIIICCGQGRERRLRVPVPRRSNVHGVGDRDRKSTRLNSSHVSISYAVFCLKKKKDNIDLQ